MTPLAQHAADLRAMGYAFPYGPVSNVPQLATLMLLVAEDVVRVNETGRTREMILQDAQLVIAGIMNGVICV